VTVLVFGAGYIGAALIAACLRDGERVVALESGFATDLEAVARLSALGDFTLVRGDVRNREDVESAFRIAGDITIVHHLAAQASASPDAASAEFTEEVNLRGPRHVFEASIAHSQARGVAPPHVTYGSSFHCYGSDLTGIVDETRAYGAQGDLSHLSKIYAEKLGEMHARRDGLTVVPVRLGIVYGVGPVMKRDRRFVTVPHAFCLRRLAREPVTVTASGARPLAFCHLDDAVAAMRVATVGLAPGVYAPANAATEVLTAYDVRDVVDQEARRFGIPVPDDSPAPGLPSRFSVSSRLHDAGWLPRREMREAMTDVVAYFHAASLK
jgi:nucleoside-diphosphate-sugar epimerase